MRHALIACLLIAASLPGKAQTSYPLRQYLSIRSAAAPTLSPDGSEVAFSTNITGTAQVWKVPKTSGWPDQLTFFPSSVSATAWSPTGKGILVAADDNGNEQFQLYLLNGEGTQTTPLTTNPK